MKLYFDENTNLKRKFYYLQIIIIIIMEISIYRSLGNAFIAIMLTILTFIFLRIVLNNYVRVKDDRAFYAMISILYDQRNPKKFLKEIDDRITFGNLSKNKVITVLIHKSIAKCYNGEIDEAKDLLNELVKQTEDENALVKISFYQIMFKIIEEKIDSIDDDILTFKKIINSKKTEKLTKSKLKSDIVQLKFLEYFDTRIFESELLSMIIRADKLTYNHNELFGYFLKSETSKLRSEMLNYYAAVNLVNIGDKAGAIDYLGKIDTLPVYNTVIQKRAIELLEKIK